MSTSSMAYWTARKEADDIWRAEHEDACIQRLKSAFESTRAEIEKTLEKYYSDYADLTGAVSMDEAKKPLTASERNALRKRIAQLRKEGGDEAEIKKLTARVKISRQEALLSEINLRLSALASGTVSTMEEDLAEILTEQDLKNFYDLEKQIGLEVDFDKFSDAQVQAFLSAGYDGQSFSNKIWYDQKQLAHKLDTSLPRLFMLGTSIQKISKQLAADMQTKLSNATRLVRTEGSYMAAQADMHLLSEAGIEEYEFLATLDSRTSEICASMDGKRFQRKDAASGVNLPPMHPNCRSTTLPVVDMSGLEALRLAKDENGKYFTVPSGTTYEDWKAGKYEKSKVSLSDEYVVSQAEYEKALAAQAEAEAEYLKAQQEAEKAAAAVFAAQEEGKEKIDDAMEAINAAMDEFKNAVAADIAKMNASLLEKYGSDYEDTVKEIADKEAAEKAAQEIAATEAEAEAKAAFLKKTENVQQKLKDIAFWHSQVKPTNPSDMYDFMEGVGDLEKAGVLPAGVKKPIDYFLDLSDDEIETLKKKVEGDTSLVAAFSKTEAFKKSYKTNLIEAIQLNEEFDVLTNEFLAQMKADPHKHDWAKFSAQIEKEKSYKEALEKETAAKVAKEQKAEEKANTKLQELDEILESLKDEPAGKTKSLKIAQMELKNLKNDLAAALEDSDADKTDISTIKDDIALAQAKVAVLTAEKAKEKIYSEEKSSEEIINTYGFTFYSVSQEKLQKDLVTYNLSKFAGMKECTVTLKDGTVFSVGDYEKNKKNIDSALIQALSYSNAHPKSYIAKKAYNDLLKFQTYGEKYILAKSVADSLDSEIQELSKINLDEVPDVDKKVIKAQIKYYEQQQKILSKGILHEKNSTKKKAKKSESVVMGSQAVYADEDLPFLSRIDRTFDTTAYTEKRRKSAVRCTTSKQGDDVLREKCGEVWRSDETDEMQKSAAWRYTAGSGMFNRALRAYNPEVEDYIYGENPNTRIDPEAVDAANRLTQLIERSTYDFDMQLSRGIKMDSGSAKFLGVDAEFLEQMVFLDNRTEENIEELKGQLVGKRVTEWGFMSTCVLSKGSKLFVDDTKIKLNVFAPAGTKMLYAEPFSAYGGSHENSSWDGVSGQTNFGPETEVILQQHTTLEIRDVYSKNGILNVDVDVVAQDALVEMSMPEKKEKA